MVNNPFYGSRGSGLILILVSATVFSTAGLFVKIVKASFWSILFWRGVTASIFTISWLGYEGRLSAEFSGMGKAGLSAAVVGALGTIAFVAAFKFTSIANVSLIYAAVPFVAAAIAWVWIREQPTQIIMLASIAAFAGVLTIVSGSLEGINLRGDLLALWMTFAMAVYLVIYRVFPGTPAAGPAVLSSLLLMPIAWIMGDPMAISGDEFLIISGFGLVFAIASVTLAEGARRLPAAETALISALETPLAPLWVWWLLSEIPATETFIGGTIILLALLSAQLPGLKSR